MKTRLRILILVTLLTAGPVAAAETTGWTSWTSTIKVKVREWVDYWRGTPANSVAAQPPVGGSAAPSPAPRASSSVASPSIAPRPLGAAPSPAESSSAAPKVARDASREVREASLQVAKLRESVRAHDLTRVAKVARPGASDLPRSAAGVPVTDFAKLRAIKTIARLDIGTEAEISREEFKIETAAFALTKPNDLAPLPSPEPVKFDPGATVGPAYGPRVLQGHLRSVEKPVDLAAVQKIAWALGAVASAPLLPYRPLDEERLKMVAALLLFASGDRCHLAMGLFGALAPAESTRAEATYHLGACAVTMKMHQVAFDELAKLVRANDPEFGRAALEALVKDLQPAQELAFYTLLDGLKDWKTLAEPKSQDLISYRLAKGAFRAKAFAKSLAQAKLVHGEFADDARVLVAMNHFALNDKASATKVLEELSAAIEARQVQDKNVRALTAVNLGRLYFASQKYAPALEQYAKVPKDHPLWVQALVEQGWTQIATEDFSGAIGNMYSLHSPYFRAVYQPESFAVRTIGYLNICQYGDAYRTLSQLEKEYRDFQTKTAAYLMNHDADQTYASVRSYIQGKSGESVDGVPSQVWREMARRKDFLNVQTALNDATDEALRYGGVNEKIKAEKASIRAKSEAAKKHFDEYRAKIAAFGQDPARATQRKDYEANLRRERDRVIGFRFQLAMLEQSRQGYLDLRARASQRLDARRGELTREAGQLLLGHARQISGEMSRVLDNNELLRYEVFAGSGENIRYQVAGGQVGNAQRVPASIKPTKMMNWNFDGEFWEDEIGSYRSSLQNNCPTAVPNQANLKHDEE